MTRATFFTLVCTASFWCGILLYCIGKEYIIIRLPHYYGQQVEKNQTQEKKKILLHFWRTGRWQSETVETLWPSTDHERVHVTIQPLLAVMEEEGIVDKKITLQSATISASGNDLYLSFDRAPFDKESSTLDQLMIIESIVKTIRGNGITVPNVYFLVHHKVIHHPHLDFGYAWPSTGFTS